MCRYFLLCKLNPCYNRLSVLNLNFFEGGRYHGPVKSLSIPRLVLYGENTLPITIFAIEYMTRFVECVINVIKNYTHIHQINYNVND